VEIPGRWATVTLAPATKHGVADCAVTVNGTEYIVEVSGFPSNPFKSDPMAFNGAMQHALKAAIHRTISAAISPWKLSCPVRLLRHVAICAPYKETFMPASCLP
jgi:hypothetical protein